MAVEYDTALAGCLVQCSGYYQGCKMGVWVTSLQVNTPLSLPRSVEIGITSRMQIRDSQGLTAPSAL